jgi:predicted DNA-binding protein
MTVKSYDPIAYTRLPEPVKRDVERLASARGATIAQVIREAVIFYIQLERTRDRAFSSPVVFTVTDTPTV